MVEQLSIDEMLRINENTIAAANAVLKEHFVWSNKTPPTKPLLYQLLCLHCSAHIPAANEYGYADVSFCTGGCGARFCSAHCAESFAEEHGIEHGVDCAVIGTLRSIAKQTDGFALHRSSTCCLGKKKCTLHKAVDTLVLDCDYYYSDGGQRQPNVVVYERQLNVSRMMMNQWFVMCLPLVPAQYEKLTVLATYEIALMLSVVHMYSLSNSVLMLALAAASRRKIVEKFAETLKLLATNHFSLGNTQIATNMSKRAIQCSELSENFDVMVLLTKYQTLNEDERCAYPAALGIIALASHIACEQRVLRWSICDLSTAVYRDEFDKTPRVFNTIIKKMLAMDETLDYVTVADLFYTVGLLLSKIENRTSAGGALPAKVYQSYIDMGHDLLDAMRELIDSQGLLYAEYMFYCAHFWGLAQYHKEFVYTYAVESMAHYKAQFGAKRYLYAKQLLSLQKLLIATDSKSNHDGTAD